MFSSDMPMPNLLRSTQLADFQERGRLPFTGRRTEMDRLVRFWQDTFEAQALRALLMVGEAGIGKSRLIDEVVALIRSDNGAVLHVRFGAEPEIGIPRTALHAELARLANEDWRQEFSIPNDRLSTVITCMQRLARTRPTVLVLEDIHLLNEDALAECSTVLQSLADEAISVVCAARTVDVMPRGILERYLVAELLLGGLTKAEITSMWNSLFGETGSPEIITALEHATHGNPLAIVAALSEALGQWQPGSTEPHQLDSTTTASDGQLDTFRTRIEAGVAELAARMASHLDAQECAAASAFAGLGEMFAREAAALLMADAESSIAALIAKGILTVTPVAPAPVVGSSRDNFPASDYPLLAFAHSLLHEHFVHTRLCDRAQLAQPVVANAPLYSVLPFQLLGTTRLPAPLPIDLVRAGVERAIGTAYRLDEGPQWELAPLVFNAADVLESSLDLDAPDSRAWTDSERVDIKCKVLGCRLSLMRRAQYSDAYFTLVDQFLTITANPADTRAAAQHVLALTHRHRAYTRTQPDRCLEVWSRVHELVEQFPDLRSHRSYVLYLRDVAQFARRMEYHDLGRDVEQRLNTTLALPTTPESLRIMAMQTIVPAQLLLFNTPEELQRRMESYEQLDRIPDDTMSAIMPKLHFLLATGRMQEVRALALRSLPQIDRLGLERTGVYTRLALIEAEAVLEHDLSNIQARAAAVLADTPESLLAGARLNMGFMLTMACVLRGRHDLVRTVLEQYPESLPALTPELRYLLGLAPEFDSVHGAPGADEPAEKFDGHGIGIGKTIPKLPAENEPMADARFQALHSVMTLDGVQSGSGNTTLLTALRESLERPILRIDDVFAVAASIKLVSTHGIATPAGTETAELVGTGARAIVNWLFQHGLIHCAESALERYGEHLRPADREGMAVAVQAARIENEATANAHRIRLTMLGTVAVENANGELVRVRGARLRAMLGLMVADQMLERPLGHREFLRIAAGHQGSHEQARKVVNITVYRLRDMLGQQAITTDGETPRLNLHRVSVDLLDASELMNEVDEALVRGAMMRAHLTLARVLSIVGGETAFPTLTESFFEAARKDFEGRLRNAVIDVARGLLYEGNVAPALSIVDRAMALYPTDPELLELRGALRVRAQNATA